jgi:hypothetical protein
MNQGVAPVSELLEMSAIDDVQALVGGGCSWPCRGWLSDSVALELADVASTCAVGDLTEFLDIDVQQVAGLVVFVAAKRFTGDPVTR